MRYHLLTGATGLLGRYLLRDLMLAGIPVAVIVRPTRLATPERRIDFMLSDCEARLGRALPRPIVLNGDLCDPDFGLNPQDLAWVGEHCEAVLHNAASLIFQTTPDGEPYRSNVQGTAHALELCRKSGIRKFHHVSTAYVCGTRVGRILESELNVGQELGNDYERCKIQAEKMVREADFLDQPTVFRPSIIVGDSQTGFTSTFHGFYTPLRLVHALAKAHSVSNIVGQQFLGGLGMEGNEHKNLVPVDWVSAVTAHIVSHPQHHGQTYHLTNPQPVRARDMNDAIGRAIVLAMSESGKPAAASELSSEVTAGFREQMLTYQSYWRDDPEFDAANTSAAAGHLPCPALDSERMMKLAKFAIDANFGWPRAEITAPAFDAHRHLAELAAAGEREGFDPSEHWLGLQVNGAGGGQWHLRVKHGVPAAVGRGLSGRCSATFYLNSETFATLARGRGSVEQAVHAGRVLVEGNGLTERQLTDVLQAVFSPAHPRTASAGASPAASPVR